LLAAAGHARDLLKENFSFTRNSEAMNKMLERLKPILPQKLFRSETRAKPGQGAEQNHSEIIEELFEIADELDVVMTAFMSPEFKESESLGLYLILRRQTNRIRFLGTDMCAWG